MERALGVLHRECDEAKPPVGLQVEPGRQQHAAHRLQRCGGGGRVLRLDRQYHEAWRGSRTSSSTSATRGAMIQFTLSTASMKLNVLVSTHSTGTASTFIVPMRSVLLVTARPLAGDGLMSRATAMPRRGSHLNVSVEASAVPAGVCGVNMSATVGYPPAV